MALLEKHLFVKKSTIPNAGKGLFTKIFIPKGTRIVEYKGRRTIWKEVKDNHENAYLYTINNNNVIDAGKTLSALARYANDAKGITRVKGINNNCIYVNDNNRAYIESVKDIQPGSEIFVDYTKEYWDVMRVNIREREKDKALAAKKKTKTGSSKKTSTKKKAARKK
jgi:SET domain-containing protein